MSKIISIGKFNNNDKYILLSILFLFLKNMAFGINYNSSFAEIKLFPDEGQSYFSKHKYIHLIFCYFFTLIMGIIHSSIELINQNTGSLYFSSSSFLNLLFTIFLWVIMDFFMDFYTHTLIY